MKIIHIIDQFNQLTGGGSVKVPFELSQIQAKQGHDVTIITSDYQIKGQVPAPGVKLKVHHCYLNLLGGLRITPATIFDIGVFHKADIIHLHNYRTFQNLATVFDLNLSNHTVILHAHGNAAPVQSRFKIMHDALWRTVIKSSSRYIANSFDEVQQYQNEGAKLVNIQVIPVGIRLSEFEGIQPENNRTGKTICFLGRLHENKGLDLLLYALARLPSNVTLNISGIDYGQEEKLRRLVKTLDLTNRVVWYPPMYNRDKAYFYANADLYVMPSRYEAWGITFMEALACGTPVVMTDTCGAAKILPDYCGMVAECNSVSIAETIMQALSSNLCDHAGAKRIEWVSQFSWENTVDKIHGLYMEALAERCIQKLV